MAGGSLIIAPHVTTAARDPQCKDRNRNSSEHHRRKARDRVSPASRSTAAWWLDKQQNQTERKKQSAIVQTEKKW